jgi:3-methyladenine DNA glycosylase AlkC
MVFARKVSMPGHVRPYLLNFFQGNAMTKATKGAASRAAVNPEHKAQLECGVASSRTLSELLAMDLQSLLHSVDARAAKTHPIDASVGITLRMQQGAAALFARHGAASIEKFATHPSDTVRGWAAYCVPLLARTLPDVLSAIQPFAADAHFGVREWAWLAVRPQLAATLPAALAALVPWTSSEDERLRRFACEALRPRGVWCTHIAALKADPGQALPLLRPLRADPARYVQDSLANWLNDASKDQPDWVRELVEQWRAESTDKASEYICRRALRSIRSD